MSCKSIVLFLIAAALFMCGSAIAQDVTVTYGAGGTVTIDPPNGVGSVGGDVIIVNNSGGPITVTVTQSDGTKIMDGVAIANGASDSATVTTAGSVEVCRDLKADCVYFTYTQGAPGLSGWGIGILIMLVLGSGVFVLRRMRLSPN